MIKQYQISECELKEINIPGNHKGMFKKNGHRKRLNRLEIQRVIELYPDYFNWQLARKFNVSESVILKIRLENNLRKSDKIMNETRFKKGHIPTNKGLTFPDSNIGGQTKFKNGHLPHNTKWDGYITKRWHKKDKDYYIYIRVDLAKWQLLQRYIWEQNTGQKLNGEVIRFKDGNRENYDINNLECISRAENMKRNRNRKKAAESMKRIWRMEKMRQNYGLRRHTKLRIA